MEPGASPLADCCSPGIPFGGAVNGSSDMMKSEDFFVLRFAGASRQMASAARYHNRTVAEKLVIADAASPCPV